MKKNLSLLTLSQLARRNRPFVVGWDDKIFYIDPLHNTYKNLSSKDETYDVQVVIDMLSTAYSLLAEIADENTPYWTMEDDTDKLEEAFGYIY